MFNGKQSRVWTSKDETAIPTADNESIMITTEIDDKEGRYIMGLDVHNMFTKKKLPTKKRKR